MKKQKSEKQRQLEMQQKHREYIANLTLFSRPLPRVKVPTKKETTMQDVIAADRNKGKVFKSAPITPQKLEKPIRYEGDMAEREAKAQQEIERKKMRIAPAYSKGAYQYITDETDLTAIGRKI